MMELRCAIVLTIVNLVTAIPHEYGVKGGAVAKADASAVAGAYSGLGIPLSIPSGSGYSGSYSKSSSSSFASSSASASSSSFNFNGAGPGAIPGYGVSGLSGVGGNGAAYGTGSCTSGACLGGATNGIPASGSASTGTGQTYSGANAAAAAGSTSSAGLPAYANIGNHATCVGADCLNKKPSGCEGSNCDDDKKCTSGQCVSTVPTGSSSTDYDSKNKCTTGQCGPNLQPGTAASSYGSNDIPVNTGSSGSKATSDASAQSSNFAKTSTGYAGSRSDCSLENCGPTAPSNLKPSNTPELPDTYQNSFAPNQKQVSSKCDTPNCESFSTQPSASSNPFNKPATYLTAPKQGPCTSSNCESPTESLYDKPNLPSSYNVPIHATYSIPNSSPGKVSCTSENCRNEQTNVPHALKGTTEESCTSPNCRSSDGIFKTPSYAHAPAYQVPSGPNHSQSPVSASNCATSDCESYPTGPSNFGSPTKVPSNSQDALPDFVPLIPVTTITASSPVSKYPVSTHSSGLPSYSSSFAHAETPTGANTLPGAFSPSKPSGSNPSPSQKLPFYTGGFGGPAGVLKPNEFNSQSNLPISNNKPISPAGSYYPTPCPNGNCGPQPGQLSPQHYQNESPNRNPDGSFSTAVYRPPSPLPPPFCPAGNCGSKPNQPSFFGQSSTPNEGLHRPIVPAGGHDLPPCSSVNCGLQSGHLSPQYDQSRLPSRVPPSQQAPICPPGGCKPQTNQPLLPYGQNVSPIETLYKPSPPAGTQVLPSCSSGNCGTQPGQLIPQYGQSGSQYKPPTGVYNPVDCAYGNCGPRQPGQSLSPIGSTGLQYKPTSSSGKFNQNPCTSGNCGPTVPAGTYKPTSCPSGNCETQSVLTIPSYVQTASQIGSSYKPIPTTGNYNPVPCSSGNCGSLHGATHGVNVIAGAGASANSVVYTGGFGGPPGLLKPYDDGKLGTNPFSSGGKYPVGSQITGNHGGVSGSGVHSSYGKSLNGAGTAGLVNAGAQASAVAGATSGTYGGGTNLHGNFNSQTGDNENDNSVTSGCKGGCGSNGLNGVLLDAGGLNAASAGARSIANAGSSAGAFGSGGSFASSSATAHASAGAATKGGYGKR